MAHEGGGYGSSPHMRVVAWSILVMGISLAIVMVLYVWIGWIPGSGFSDEVMREQQAELREQYDLPPVEPVPEELLETPPSLRNLTSQ